MTPERMKHLQSSDRNFRWRAHEPMRIEGLSDAVFAFAITLIVISLEVPKSFDDLAHAMSGFFVFALSFMMLVLVWYRQHIWFRRYGLQDAISIMLNAALLFVVIFYVYPLKFLLTVFATVIHLNGDGRQLSDLFANDGQLTSLMMIYCGGYVAVYGIFVALQWHAWRLRDQLELNPAELIETRFAIIEDSIMAGIGLVAFLFSAAGLPGLGGLCFFGIAPLQFAQGTLRGRAQRRLREG